MPSLSARQRALLSSLLEDEAPQSLQALAARLHLSPRQVRYALHGATDWLAGYGLQLETKPGVGVVISGPQREKKRALQALQGANTPDGLTNDSRQQLLALWLLEREEPLILYQMQQATLASRHTVLADLDRLHDWLTDFALALKRRRNVGIWIEGPEKRKRQAMLALLWGKGFGEQRVFSVSYAGGLALNLPDDCICPLHTSIREIIQRWDVRRALHYVATAESQIGGRFTDDGALFLALALALQADRIASGQQVVLEEEMLAASQDLPMWETATKLARQMARSHYGAWPDAEVALLTMYLLATPRNERWPGDLGGDHRFAALIDDFTQQVGGAFGVSELAQDAVLRDSLLVLVTPAYYRQVFDLWMPDSIPEMPLSLAYTREYDLANALSQKLNQHTGVSLSAADISGVAALLRAAYIRERPQRPHRILVVCPSGMATSQLLTARIRARFPRLQNITVASMRHLFQQPLQQIDLILTTAPLAQTMPGHIDVIQVHPLLLPADVEAITQWLATHQNVLANQ